MVACNGEQNFFSSDEDIADGGTGYEIYGTESENEKDTAHQANPSV